MYGLAPVGGRAVDDCGMDRDMCGWVLDDRLGFEPAFACREVVIDVWTDAVGTHVWAVVGTCVWT